MNISKKAGAAICLLLLLLLCPLKAAGAELEDISTSGMEILSEEQKNQVEDAVFQIPEAVMQKFQRLGGKLIFQNAPILLDKWENIEIWGAYWPGNNQIVVRTAPEIYEASQGSLASTVLHEYGHFVYQHSVHRLSKQSRDILQQNYNYYKNYSPLCYNENETFACFYAWHYLDMAEVSADMQNVIKEAETLCGEVKP